MDIGDILEGRRWIFTLNGLAVNERNGPREVLSLHMMDSKNGEVEKGKGMGKDV